jgi:hypothetical protein
VVGPRHSYLAAKRAHGISHALVVRGNDDRINGSGFRGTPIYVFDHRPPRDSCQRLPGEARRRVTGGDDNDGAGENGAGGLVGRNGDGHVES